MKTAEEIILSKMDVADSPAGKIMFNKIIECMEEYAASRDSRILSAVPSEEIEYYVTERELFIKTILEQEWDQPMRTSAESMIIAYDQMLDKLKRGIAE